LSFGFAAALVAGCLVAAYVAWAVFYRFLS
jgi:hypothetical protein